MKASRLIFLLALSLCVVLCIGGLLAKEKGKAVGSSVDRDDVIQRLEDTRDEGSFALRKAASMLTHARNLVAQGESNKAVNILNKVVQMDLPENREADKLIADSYLFLGNIYQAEAGGLKSIDFFNRAIEHMSAELDAELMADTVYVISKIQNGLSPTNLGFDQGSASSPMAPLDAGDDTCGEAVEMFPPECEVMSIYPAGDHNWRSFTLSEPSLVRIETLSDDIYGDDTDLNLYGGCTDSTPTDFIAFDDDGGPGFLSLIESPCLDVGTYYVEVGGYGDYKTPDDFELCITVLDTCVIPEADKYEPDDEIAQANKIGFRNNGVGEGNQYGRDKKNIQHHSIYPAMDIDFVKFNLSRSNWVRIETFGNENPDTVMGLSFPDGLLLAVNDDKAVGDPSSKIEVCLPPGEWLGVTIAYFASDTFPYDWAVDVEYPCLFEDEPNGSLETANAIEPGETIHGIFSYAPVGDEDFFVFTLDEAALATIETSGYDKYDVDTRIELYDSNGVLIDSDEDGGPGFLSMLTLVLDPGTYYINCGSYYAKWYYPYGLTLTLSEAPVPESEPNDDCTTANPVDLGNSILASINPAGDYDYFMLTVPEDTYVEIETSGPSGDTVLNIYSADGIEFIGCDDDSGDGLFSLWSCCLPAGDYCVEVRAYSAWSTISEYTVAFRNLGECTPSEPLECPSTGLSCP